MTCAEFVALVTEYLDGALTDPAFTRHLAECSGCPDYLDQLRRTVELLREGQVPPGHRDANPVDAGHDRP